MPITRRTRFRKRFRQEHRESLGPSGRRYPIPDLVLVRPALMESPAGTLIAIEPGSWHPGLRVAAPMLGSGGPQSSTVIAPAPLLLVRRPPLENADFCNVKLPVKLAGFCRRRTCLSAGPRSRRACQRETLGGLAARVRASSTPVTRGPSSARQLSAVGLDRWRSIGRRVAGPPARGRLRSKRRIGRGCADPSR
jgi:hypothetical protein